MKKYITLILSALVALSFISCEKSDSADPTTPAPTVAGVSYDHIVFSFDSSNSETVNVEYNWDPTTLQFSDHGSKELIYDPDEISFYGLVSVNRDGSGIRAYKLLPASLRINVGLENTTTGETIGIKSNGTSSVYWYAPIDNRDYTLHYRDNFDLVDADLTLQYVSNTDNQVYTLNNVNPVVSNNGEIFSVIDSSTGVKFTFDPSNSKIFVTDGYSISKLTYNDWDILKGYSVVQLSNFGSIITN